MVFITEQLIRKRSEHNELMISTLEELSLHQEDIERIEYIGNWCRELKILLLQSNLIPKIENLHKLKKLEYLNLAINNIERIENLEPLESLHKLDLTLNFIGELSTVESLRDNYNLRELFLTGNPCTDYPGYRDYVICVLPQLESLDGKDVTVTERLKARLHYKQNRENIVQLELKHNIVRDQQKIRVARAISEQEEDVQDLNEEEHAEQFWQQKSEHCPETRILMAKYSKRTKQRPAYDCSDSGEPKAKRTPVFFAECGRPYSLNEPKLKFDFLDEDDRYELNLHVYRFLDTSLIEVDAQPNYVRASIKGKVFQLALRHEIKTDASTCKRSTTTGHLLIIMPKLNPENICFNQSKNRDQIIRGCLENAANLKRELKGTVNYRNIVSDDKGNSNSCIQTNDDEVPPLI